MGQAKARAAALHDQIALHDIEAVSFEPLENEKDSYDALIKLPRIQVVREAAHMLAYMRMLPQKCHENCYECAQMDPEKSVKMISGWWVQNNCLVSHSVVLRHGSYLCLTPQLLGVPSTFEMIIDPAITLTRVSGGSNLRRNGQTLPQMLRREPHLMLSFSKEAKRRIKLGERPSVVWDGFLQELDQTKPSSDEF